MTPPHWHSEECSFYCHSEERTPKNLRCHATSRVAGGMNWPSDGDLRFLTAFGMTGVRWTPKFGQVAKRESRS